MLEQLNALTRGAKLPEGGGYTPHPLGEFNGQIVAITKKMHDERPLYEIEARTAVGTAKYTVWGYNASDINKAANDPKFRETVEGGIGRTKRLFVDLGVWTEDQAVQAVWSGSSPGVLNDMAHLKGKRCWVVVRQSTKDAQKQVVWLNAPRDGVADQNLGSGHEAPSGAHSAPPTADLGQAPSQAPELMPLPDVPQTAPGLNDIPF